MKSGQTLGFIILILIIFVAQSVSATPVTPVVDAATVPALENNVGTGVATGLSGTGSGLKKELIDGFADTGNDTGVAGGAGENLFLTFLGIFLIGLALNLTPCVYPMLAITVSIFGQQSEAKPFAVFLRAVVYILGMATMYSILGLFAALTGGLFGSVLQSPLVLLLISALFFGLSLSMFGLYELQMPSSLLNRIGGARSASFIGTYLSGLFVGVFAAPCVGPPVIGLLTLVGHRGDPLFGFLVFFVLSLGLGFPYLILGTFSGLLNRLPRSGAWMNWVKKLLGTVLVAVGCFYLSLALNPALTFVLIPLTFLLGGIYLGFVENSPTTSRLFAGFKKSAGILLAVLAVLVFRAGQVPALEWQKYPATEAELAGPAVVYFSASWCIPCLELDRRTFTDAGVIAALSQVKHFKVDLSQFDSPESQKLREKYRIAGVPTLVFINAAGQEVKSERVVGFVTPEEMLARFERAKAAEQIVSPVADVAAAEPEEKPSEAFLVADVDGVVPGRPFKLAVHFKLIDGWHVYWLNPGDSGTEPQITWKLPDGFTVGAPEWPVPQRFDKPPFATFGHENELLLAHRVGVPEALASGSMLTFEAEVSWLVCKEICIAQDGVLMLQLPVVSGEAPVNKVSASLFAQTSANLPVVTEDWEFRATFSSRSARLEAAPKLAGRLDETTRVSFFPAQQGVFRTGGSRTLVENGKIVATMPRTGLKLDPLLNGVLLVENGSERQILQVATAWSSE